MCNFVSFFLSEKYDDLDDGRRIKVVDVIRICIIRMYLIIVIQEIKRQILRVNDIFDISYSCIYSVQVM